ncbi:DegT/DnrJ/EryC1/StrS family aminotransferase [Georgenia sp. Z1344]|uniref:DegT/DnrJ/EryC1/StrS family aminotransferase n=1 Tax=Georgenia sp. Z1344 TaxID=3416706 RepID=UPI003CEBA3EE
MADRIFLSSPDVTELEEQALLRAFRSGWIAPLGPEVNAFEEEIARFVGRNHAVALSSGTAALHLGLINLGVGPGQVVITASMTFAATANAITYTGAEPVFVDSDESGNMSPALLEEAIEDERRLGSTIGAIIPVDLLGKPADYAEIEPLAAKYGIPVLSDAAESLGAVRDGRPAGQPGVAAAISFNGNKIMTTSGGGMLVTNDADLADRTRYLATQARQPVPYYEHTDIGYNYRLSNLLAGLGRAQLGRLHEMVERRRQNRLRYRKMFTDVPGVEIFGQPDGANDVSGDHDNFWLTSMLVDPLAAGWDAYQLREHLAEANMEARPLWKPMHLQPVFGKCTSYLDGTSERLYRTGISMPSGSSLTTEQFNRIQERVHAFIDLVE